MTEPTDAEIEQKMREMYQRVYGFFPNDEQLKDWVNNEIKPMVERHRKAMEDYELKRTP